MPKCSEELGVVCVSRNQWLCGQWGRQNDEFHKAQICKSSHSVIYICPYCNLCPFMTLENSEMVIFICKLLSHPQCCWLGYHQFLHYWCPRPHSVALCCRLIFSLCYLDFLPGVPWSSGVVSFLNLLFWCSVRAIAVKVFKERLVRGIFLDSHILVIYICFPLISCLGRSLDCFTMSLGWCCPIRPCPWSGLYCQLLFGHGQHMGTGIHIWNSRFLICDVPLSFLQC